MTDYHTPPYSWYDAPDEEEPCEECEGAGCKYCDAQMAYDEYCDREAQAKKDGEQRP